jgi:hypothetical protein
MIFFQKAQQLALTPCQQHWKTPLTLIFHKAKITFSIITLRYYPKTWKNASLEGSKSKFKAEVCLLLMAIALFVVSTFFYSFQGRAFSLGLNYPYRGYAIPFVGFGSVLMVAATISYSKRSKNCV